jgi:hypothetical protein
MSIREGLRKELKQRYSTYESIGYSTYAVTLSTYIASRGFARENMRDYWDCHFIGRVKRCFPFKMKNQFFDHDFIVEKSPGGHYHYHGLMAFPSDTSKKIWRDGELNPQLRRDLDSFRSRGKHRMFCVNKHLIEPVHSCLLDTWIRYITKEKDIPLSSTH